MGRFEGVVCSRIRGKWFSKVVWKGMKTREWVNMNGERKKLWGWDPGADAHTMRTFPRGRSGGLRAWRECRQRARNARRSSGTNI
jgi:hypothetical protein